MHLTPTTPIALAFTLALATTANAIRIIHGNDDGWAEQLTRVYHASLRAAGHDAVLSAPAQDRSGTGGLDAEPTPRADPCHYGSCPAATNRTTGRDPADPRLNWVNSYPVTAMRHGIEVLGPALWGEGDDTDGAARPDLAVAGPNIGNNLHPTWPSGTVNAVVYGARHEALPGVAFSAHLGADDKRAWNATAVPEAVALYAALAARFTRALVDAGAPYLPPLTWLNVNFPGVREGCARAEDFRWVFTRLGRAAAGAPPDLELCGLDRLPRDRDVVRAAGGCFVSVSLGSAVAHEKPADDYGTASREEQAVVYEKLARTLGWTCAFGDE